MRKSLFDKCFFIDKIFEVDSVFDFGCADGSLIKFLYSIFPSYKYYGYDSDPKMIEFSSNNSNITVSNDLNKLTNQAIPKRSVLNLSSVVHEVYSYCTKLEIEEFWNYVFSSGYKYISIRDMFLDENIQKASFQSDLQLLLQNADSNMLCEFEQEFGSVTSYKNLIHFLCKYRYVANWSREVKENYFPISSQELFRLIPNNYEIVYKTSFLLPFLENVVYNDFGIKLKEHTHMQVLLRRKEVII